MHTQPLTTEIFGKEFFLAHGDGLGDPDPKFKLLRSMFHNRTLQRIFAADSSALEHGLGANLGQAQPHEAC